MEYPEAGEGVKHPRGDPGGITPNRPLEYPPCHPLPGAVTVKTHAAGKSILSEAVMYGTAKIRLQVNARRMCRFTVSESLGGIESICHAAKSAAGAAVRPEFFRYHGGENPGFS